MYDFSNKVVVVTGAAGNLGKAVVTEFLETGAVVCGLDHRQGRLEKMFPTQPNIHIYENVDLNDRDAVIDLGVKIITKHGHIDVVVNTVGGFTMGERVDQISAETWGKMININVHSLLNISAACVPAMIDAGKGKIISIGAGAALKGGAHMGAYSAAKSAVLRLTESMAAELKPYNIQANCVLPGTIDTPENRKAMPNADFTKWVAPKYIARGILFLASADADAVSGVALPVTG